MKSIKNGEVLLIVLRLLVFRYLYFVESFIYAARNTNL